jgi:hypothetical protein
VKNIKFLKALLISLIGILLLAGCDNGGPIDQLMGYTPAQPTTAAPAATQAPTVNNGFVVQPTQDMGSLNGAGSYVQSSGEDTSAHEGTDSCSDGLILPNVLANVPDVPWGRNEGAVVAEIAWKPGTGFANWDRIVAIAERVEGGRMPYANNVKTVHAVQYCGSLQAIMDYAPHHVTALVNSSQDSAGNRPYAREIPVVFLHNDGSISWVVQVSDGPSMETIKAHLEMRP